MLHLSVKILSNSTGNMLQNDKRSCVVSRLKEVVCRVVGIFLEHESVKLTKEEARQKGGQRIGENERKAEE